MRAHWLFALLCAGTVGSAAPADLLAVYQRAIDTDPLWRQATATRLAIHEAKTQAVLGLLPLDVSANKNFIGIGSVQVKTPAYLAAGLSVNLFNWDSWVALKAADATVAQSEANYQAAAQSLIQGRCSAVFGQRQRNRVGVARRQSGLLRRILGGLLRIHLNRTRSQKKTGDGGQ